MKSKEVNELKRRLKKNGCTIQKMAGCFVDKDKNKILQFTETFLNLEEKVFYKYLDIADQIFTPKKVDENMLELECNIPAKREGMYKVVQSGLKDREITDAFFDEIIEGYDHIGKHLILLFYDAYDVMNRTSDNANLDESEEVYQYIVCAICPVTLTKEGLAYYESAGQIDARIRDWVVEKPTEGFIYPAFTERSTDREHLMFYTKDAKEPNEELMRWLGCKPRRTNRQKQQLLKDILKDELKNEGEMLHSAWIAFECNLERFITEREYGEEVELRRNEIESLFQNTTTYDGIEREIAKQYEEEFEEDYATAGQLMDKKSIGEGLEKEERMKKANLMQQAVTLLERHYQEETELIYQLKLEIAKERR